MEITSLSEYFETILKIIDDCDINDSCCPKCNAKYLKKLEYIKQRHSSDKYITELIFDIRRNSGLLKDTCMINNAIYTLIENQRKYYKTFTNLITSIKMLFLEISIFEKEHPTTNECELIGFLCVLFSYRNTGDFGTDDNCMARARKLDDDVNCVARARKLDDDSNGGVDSTKKTNFNDLLFLCDILPVNFMIFDGLPISLIAIKYPLLHLRAILALAITKDNKVCGDLDINFNNGILKYWLIKYNKLATIIYLHKTYKLNIINILREYRKFELSNDKKRGHGGHGGHGNIQLDKPNKLDKLEEIDKLIYDAHISNMIQYFKADQVKLYQDLWQFTKNKTQGLDFQVTLTIINEWLASITILYNTANTNATATATTNAVAVPVKLADKTIDIPNDIISHYIETLGVD